MTQQIEVREWILSIGEGGDLPPDAFNNVSDMMGYAIDHVRENVATDYVIPASWFAVMSEDGTKVIVHRHSYKQAKKVLAVPAALGAVVPMFGCSELDQLGLVILGILIGVVATILFILATNFIVEGTEPPDDEV